MAQTVSKHTLDRTAIEAASAADKEPAWLLENRLAAFDRFQSLPSPTERSEGWRRTDLSGLAFEFVPPQPASPGWKTLADVDVQHGVVVGQLRVEGLGRFENVVREAWSHVHAGLSIGKYSALAEAAWKIGSFVYVPDGVEVSEPVRLGWMGGPYPRLLVVLGKDARLSLVDTHSDGGLPVPSVVDLIVGDGAHLTYAHVQDDDRRSVSMSHQRARVGRDAKLVMLNFAMGGRVSRADVEVELVGQGAESDMLGLVFGEGDQQFDFHTLQGHRAPDTRSDLLFKSALDDRSHSTYTGTISIGKDAPRSEAYQANRNLLLAEGARADTEPKLEILIDDVARCTHGATIGPVDDEQLFYLRSRGLDTDTASRLIVEGFFQEVFHKVGDERVTAGLAKMVAPHVERLGAH
ncbi:MAG TPA: Fe-S cluster assembly protein SufD [Candidatus Eremiobacteraceae bacterium]|nr:Fe-S cluster assembly protein SufD [Candidatus Eremiobacteraceae bacterium]